MLWYKGWLETRWRFVFSLGLVAVLLVFLFWTGTKSPPPGANPISAILGMVIMSVTWVSAMLAGAGINTQPGFQATKGLHGSTHFTLSLPVSRVRLLTVRSGLGWLQQTGITALLCCGIWALFPRLRAAATGVDMLEYAAVLIAYASAFYATSVLLATLLDDLWRVWGSIIAWAGLWVICNMTPLPQSVNFFRAVGEGSPLRVHAMPWAAVGVAAGLAVALFGAASRIVRVREY